MTARSSINLPLRNLLRIVREQRKLGIVLCVLYMLGLPLIITSVVLDMVFNTFDQKSPFYHMDVDMYAGIGIFCLGAAVFMGMFVGISAYIELHKKSRVDMLYTLPLTGTQRFFTDYLGGLCIYLIPYIITMILGWILMFGLGSFANLSNTEYSNILQFLAEPIKYYAMGTMGLLVLMIFYYTLTTLITTCCGTLFESIYTNLLLNFLIPGTVAAILGVVASRTDLSFEYLWHCLGYMSPLGGLIYLFYLMDGDTTYSSYYGGIHGTETISHEMLPSYLRWIFAILAISAVLLIVAWRLYVRRKAEDVSKPFIYIGAYYVMLTLLIMLILCMMNFTIFGPVLLFAAVVYFVMEVIRKRGFRRFWLTIITYVLTVALSIGAFFAVVKTDCFGRANYVPLAATVRSVRVEAQIEDHRETFEFTDRAVISQITDFHKSIVQRKKVHPIANEEINRTLAGRFDYKLDYNGNDYYIEKPYEIRNVAENGYYSIDDGDLPYTWSEYNSNVELTYFTVAGTTVHREFGINYDEMLDLERILHNSELYKKSAVDCLKQSVLSSYGAWKHDSGTYAIPSPVRMSIYYDGISQTVSVNGGNAIADRLAAAYGSDLRRTSAEDERTAKLFCRIDEYPVYENYTETIQLLESWGFHRFTVAERYDYVDEENPYNTAASNSTANCVRIYAPGTWSAASVQYPNSVIDSGATVFVTQNKPAYEDNVLVLSDLSQKDFYPEMYALLEAAQPHYITDKECYAIVVNGQLYVLPPEHNDLAEAVIDKGSNYASDTLIEEYWGMTYTTSSAGFDYDYEEPADYYEDDDFNGNSSDVFSGTASF